MKYYKITGTNPHTSLHFIGKTDNVKDAKVGDVHIPYFYIRYKEFHSLGNFCHYQFEEITSTDEINHWEKCFNIQIYEEYNPILNKLIKNILHDILC